MNNRSGSRRSASQLVPAQQTDQHELETSQNMIMSRSQALHETAVEFVRKGDLRSALASYETIIRAYENSPKLHSELAWRYYDIGVCQYALGQIVEADTSFQNASNRNLQDARLYRNRALCKRSLGREADALEIYTEGFQQYPHDLDLLNGFALQSYRLGRLENAQGAARRIVEITTSLPGKDDLNPSERRRYANALDTAAMILDETDPVIALECFKRAVTIDPTIGERGEFRNKAQVRAK